MARGQRVAKSNGRPRADGKDADSQSQTCLYLVRKPASANASPSELRGLTQNPTTVRCRTALLRGRMNSVCQRRIASGSRQPIRRLMSAWERERGALPSPNLSLLYRKVEQGLFVLARTDFPLSLILLLVVIVIGGSRLRLRLRLRAKTTREKGLLSANIPTQSRTQNTTTNRYGTNLQQHRRNCRAHSVG